MSRMGTGTSAGSGGSGGGGSVTQGTSPWVDNITQIGGAAFSLGQQVAGSSLPVVLTAAQLSTLTPPAAITGYATSAKQDTGITSLASIDGKITAVNTGAVVLAAGSAVIGHVIADSGSVVAATLAAETTKVIGTVNIAAAQTLATVTTVGAVTAITNALPAGAALLGKVGLDQTTPGTTNGVSIAQIGGTTVVNGGVAGSLAMGGTVATNVAITANPLNLGAQAVSSENTAVTTARQVQLIADLVGKLIVLPYANPENFVSGRATATDTTSTSLVAVPAAGLRNYITQITVWNASAVSTYIKIQDGSGGTELYDIPAPAGGGAILTFPTPLRQPTTATAIFFAANASANAVFVSASGYKGA